MKRLATSILLSLALSPAFAFGQESAANNRAFFQQTTITLTSQPIASRVFPTATAETTAVRAEWSKEEDLINGSISKSKLVKMKEVTGALVNFLKDSSLTAAGYSPTWHGEYNSDKNSPGAQLKFGMTCHFAGQNADLSITANDIQPLTDQLVVNGQHFLTMRVATDFDKNTFYFNDATGLDVSAGQTKMWLVTAGNGQPLFI